MNQEQERLAYYVFHRIDVDHPSPVKIFAYGCRTGDGLIWNHFENLWIYDRGTPNRLIWDFQYDDRTEEISRTRAEEIARELTAKTAGRPVELPDEDTIRWIFQWKGNPPQNRD